MIKFIYKKFQYQRDKTNLIIVSVFVAKKNNMYDHIF